MNKPIDISVIVITYNQEKTIARTLDSIIAQKTDATVEIVIGDDSSSDSTPDICREYARKYPDLISYYSREKNLGVVGNYFQCIEDSKGRYIADCAGDDFWVDDRKLQKQYQEMEADPEVSLVHTDWRCCDIDGSNVRVMALFNGIDRSKRKVFPKGAITLGLLRLDPDSMIHLCTSLYRRDLIMSEVESHPELFLSKDYTCEDLQIMVAMSALGKVVYLPDVTLHYSIVPGSVSHQVDFEKIFLQGKGSLILIERLRAHYGIDINNLRDFYISKLDYLSAQVIYSSDKELAKEYFALKRSLPDLKSHSLKIRCKEYLMRFPILWKLVGIIIGKKSRNN